MAMQGRIFVGLFLCSLFTVGGDAQSAGITEKPVWTLEVIKVQPENLGPALAYLDDHWMRIRAEAKRRGAVLDYHRISNAVLETSGHQTGDAGSIVLLTEYKNIAAYLENGKAFRRDGVTILQPNGPGFIFRRPPLEDVFEALNTQVFVEEPDAGRELKPLTNQ